MATIIFAVLLPAPGAWAHSPLESSTPRAGEHLATMPARIELAFVAPVEDVDASVVLADDQGTDWTAGPAAVEDMYVSSPVRPGLPDGRYEIRWSVVSFDGAPMSGVVSFTVGAAEDTNPLNAVLTADAAFWVRVSVFTVLGGLLAFMAYGLVTVYGRRSRRTQPERSIGNG
ncbi:copper resistance CopC family protein [Kribbella lupini]|uniref:copper resistance CopC family protein n=1 Tax=Kribbella lupini TaxID=291602 RepID=UPI0031E4786C